jgi:molybdenum cofactor cytidylyltransferase
MQTAAVILAAGASTRYGSPKQAARIGERTMLEAVVAVANGAGLHPVIAVVPSGVAVPGHVLSAVNDDPGAGMSRSLRLGLAAVPTEADGAVILLGDQPTLDPSVIRRLLANGGGRPVVAAHAEGHIGPPVLIRREAFWLADDATGDDGLRKVLAGHPELVTLIPVTTHALDIDTPADLERLP